MSELFRNVRFQTTLLQIDIYLLTYLHTQRKITTYSGSLTVVETQTRNLTDLTSLYSARNIHVVTQCRSSVITVYCADCRVLVV